MFELNKLKTSISSLYINKLFNVTWSLFNVLVSIQYFKKKII